MANSWQRLYIAVQAVEACNRQARLGFADLSCTRMIDLRRRSLMALQHITMPCGEPCSGVFPDCTTPRRPASAVIDCASAEWLLQEEAVGHALTCPFGSAVNRREDHRRYRRNRAGLTHHVIDESSGLRHQFGGQSARVEEEIAQGRAGRGGQRHQGGRRGRHRAGRRPEAVALHRGYGEEGREARRR